MAAGFCKVRRRIAVLIFVSFLLLIGYLIGSKSLETLGVKFNENCKNGLSDRYLFGLCRNYSRKLAYGDICHLICGGKSFRQKGCIHHSSTVVIGGNLNGKKVVLKHKKISPNDYISAESLEGILSGTYGSMDGAQTAWEDMILDKVENAVGKFARLNRRKVLKQMNAPLSRNLHTMVSYLPLAAQEEYAIFGVYQDLNHFPKLHGYCGQTYAVEKLTPYSALFPAITRKLDWKRTRRLALSFLDMVIELENADGGPLQHCDIQEGNFGITDDFQVKLIDVDLILTKEKADLFLPQPNCTKDADCDFFDCISMCDVKNKKCLARRITSNLQILCRDIFKSNWPSTGLFGGVPQNIRSVLNILLQDCASKRFGYIPFKHRKVKSMIRSLKSLLSRDDYNENN